MRCFTIGTDGTMCHLAQAAQLRLLVVVSCTCFILWCNVLYYACIQILILNGVILQSCIAAQVHMHNYTRNIICAVSHKYSPVLDIDSWHFMYVKISTLN